ncbi:hypothetical protein GCM10012285_44260 [Streptomyces kronopolitis]|uniref:Uncharacterized protein n=1 Tax=Streptomyces kronopolitis TaxID=1612435 RepID=A0ABQ2JNV6_9ACTN|nr:hypothetical protein GCM10012285_44260 [Streptomyces kronopolitis]
MVSTAPEHSRVLVRMHAQMHVHDSRCRARHRSSSTLPGHPLRAPQARLRRPPPPAGSGHGAAGPAPVHLIRITGPEALTDREETCATLPGFQGPVTAAPAGGSPGPLDPRGRRHRDGYGSSAISLAFLTARASCRCC